MKEEAMRFNDGKAQYSMLDLTCLEPAVRVLEFGANKYARNNWKKGMEMSKILDSMMRHISALQNGQWTDSESYLSHIGHIQANAMFLGNINNTIDMEFNEFYSEEMEEDGYYKVMWDSTEEQEYDFNRFADKSDDELGFSDHGYNDEEYQTNVLKSTRDVIKEHAKENTDYHTQSEWQPEPVSFDEYDQWVASEKRKERLRDLFNKMESYYD